MSKGGSAFQGLCNLRNLHINFIDQISCVCSQVCGKFTPELQISYVKPDIENVTILNDIFSALEAQQSLFANLFFRSMSDQVIV